MINSKVKTLTALVIVGLMNGTCTQVLAEKPEPTIFGTYEDVKFTYGGYDFITLRVWDDGTNICYPACYIGTEMEEIETVTRSFLQEGDELISSDSPIKSEYEAFSCGLKYIYDMIGKPKSDVPVLHLRLSDERSGNAEAVSLCLTDSKYVDFAKYFIAAGDPETSIDFYAGTVCIQLPSVGEFCYYGCSVLPGNGTDVNYLSMFVHEMIHAMGMASAIDNYVDMQEYSGDIYKNGQLNGKNIYMQGLHDAFGKTPYDIAGDGKITKLISETEFRDHINNGTTPDDTETFFYMVAKEAQSGNYFTGVNVNAVLNGAVIAWPDDSLMPGVSGVPINGWELDENDIFFPELSHIELQNVLMSHQEYRNYGLLTEAEIAVLQDLGYSIDRSKFYGGSMYKSGTFSVNNVVSSALANSFTSSQDYAVGYHVYGSFNKVNSLGNTIIPTGVGAVGIRVDGIGNSITVDKEITLSGAYSTGVMFNYGYGHILTVNSPVTASGTNGIGLRFDFGDNMLGNHNDYRGSYIHTKYDENYGWKDGDVLLALIGPLMDKVVIDDNITGEDHAIYISRNAYVKSIILGDTKNVTINGNITSLWNPTSTEDEAQLNDNILYSVGITDPATLTTDLQMKKDVVVVGNISGYHSLKMDVAGGTTTQVNSMIVVHSLSGAGNITFTDNYGLISIKDTLNSSGILKHETPSADTNILIELRSSGVDIVHNVGTIQTNKLGIKTDDIDFTKIQATNVSDVQKFSVLGTGDVSNQIVKSGNTLQQGLEKVAGVLANVPNKEIAVRVEEGDLLGELQANTYNYVLNSYSAKPNQANVQLNQMNAAAVMGWRAQNNDMNKRLGELRMKTGENGVWARMSRGENKEDATKRQFNLYQVGYDQEIGHQWIAGAALSITKGNSNTVSLTGYAKGEDKSGALALYASRMNEDGSFVDLIAKYGKTSYDVTSYMTTGMGSYDYDTPTMSVSAEVGKRIKKGSYWLEPQAEFTLGMARNASYTTSNGINVDQDRFDTVVGRLGVVFGRDLPEGNIYIRASFLHDFVGKNESVLSQGAILCNYSEDLGGSWWEVGIGTNLRMGKNSYLYADVEKTYGGKMQTPWRWNLGMRWSF